MWSDGSCAASPLLGLGRTPGVYCGGGSLSSPTGVKHLSICQVAANIFGIVASIALTRVSACGERPCVPTCKLIILANSVLLPCHSENFQPHAPCIPFFVVPIQLTCPALILAHGFGD